MTDARWWLVSYDVHDDKRRAKCARHLEGHGHRVQWSVFRCWLSAREAERLRWELTELLDPADEVLLIPLCGACVGKIVGIHGAQRPAEWTDRPLRHTVV